MRRVGIVVLLLAGVWVLTQSLVLASYSIALVTEGTPDGSFPSVWRFFLSLLPVAAALALGVALIAGRRRLAERWFDDGGPEVRLTGVSLLRVGLLIIGVTMTAQAIPSLLQSLARPWLYSAMDSSSSFRVYVLESVPQFAVATCSLGIGLLLIASSRSLSKRLWFGRTSSEAEAKELALCPSCGAPYEPADYRGGLYAPKCEECGGPLDVDGT